MSKYIAHASIDENGKAKGGTAGDSTKKEVCIRTWYDKGWDYVLRIINEKVRIQFANNMIDIANNNNIGYDQNQRNTLLTQAIKVDFNFAKITVKCECDCSSMITIAYLAAVYKVLGKEEYERQKAVLVVGGNCATTSTLKSRFTKLKVVEVLYSKIYVAGTSKAVFGDIYNKAGSHVVAYIDDGKKKTYRKPLAITGVWDSATTKRAQEVFGTTVDGKVSNQNIKYKKDNPGLTSCFEWEKTPGENGSSLIKAIQEFLNKTINAGLTVDGFIGPKTIKAMQKWLKTVVDGYISNPSSMVKAFQRWLNEQ